MAEYAPVQETLAPAAGPPIDPDVLDQRRKLAQALIAQAMGGEPIGSWTQGLANLAQALMGGYNVRKTNQQEAAGRASGAADTAAALAEIAAMGGGGGGYTEPATTGSTNTGGGGGIGSDYAASMTPEEAIVRTVAGEAAGEPPQGQAAVASVILNRAKKAGKSPQQIVLAKNQFEPWARNPQRLMALTKDSPKYQQILANIQPALQGQDVTGGATHFYAPKAQATLGRNTPAWARGPYQDIGNHRFFKLAGGGGETAALPNVEPVAASPSPGVMAFLGRPNKQQYPVDPQSLDMKVGPDFLATQPQPAGLSIGDGAVARVPQPRPDPPTELPYDTGADPRTPQPRPNLAQALALPPASGRGTVPLPPVQPVARTPQPRPTPPAPAPAPAPAAAAPATTASIPQRRQAPIFREPYPSVLSAQEFARQGQNYLTGRPSFPDQQPAAPAQPRRGLLQALLGRQAPGQPAAAQAAPAGSPVAAGATAAPAAAPASSRVSALLANPYVSDAVKSAVLARLMPKQQDPFTLGPDEKRYDANGNLIATGGPGTRKIQNDANGVPRYTDTGEPVYSGDEGTGGEFFTGKSVEAQGLNFLINQGTLTKEQAANVAAGKTITAADGSLIFMTPAGIVRKPPGSDATGGDDGGYVISGPKTAGTEAETKAGGFADRMRESGRIIDSLETEGTSLAGKAVGDIPILGNYLVGDKYRQYQQAQRDFINSQLRRESGAVISDAEFENARKQYFPQPNDDAKTIANKRRNRELAVEGMKRSAGPLYKPAPEEAPDEVIHDFDPETGEIK